MGVGWGGVGGGEGARARGKGGQHTSYACLELYMAAAPSQAPEPGPLSVTQARVARERTLATKLIGRFGTAVSKLYVQQVLAVAGSVKHLHTCT